MPNHSNIKLSAKIIGMKNLAQKFSNCQNRQELLSILLEEDVRDKSGILILSLEINRKKIMHRI